MPIDTRAKAKQIAGRAQQREDKLGANQDRGLMQELNYRKASKQSDRFTRVGQQMEAGTYKAPKKNRDVNKFDEGQDASNMNIEDYDFGKKYNMRDIKYLKSQGFSDDQIAKDVAARDQSIGGRQGSYLKKTGNLAMVANEGQDEGLRSIAKSRAQTRANNRNSNNNNSNQNNNNSNQNNNNSNQGNNNSVNDSMNDSSTTNTTISNSGNSGDGSGNTIDGNGNAVGVGNVAMRDATVDNSETYGDTTITNSNVGPGARVGNFNFGINMNSGNMNIGGMNGEENASGNGEAPFSALQAGVAGAALMQNLSARSYAMNGTPMDKAAEANARSKERFDYNAFAQNNYNLLGQLQGAFQARADKSYADLYGDVYDGVTPPIKYPDRVTPDQPEDKTDEIADGLDI